MADTLSYFYSNFYAHFQPQVLISFLVFYAVIAAIVRLALPEPVNTRNFKNPKKELALYYG